ncbi:uncharacterized protein LOC108475201 [Gossypium arboreum]|uniref:uncharacterized protein LOC108475201 n=1 Tax=Gossypium arboreum TaxID=29729 RepID=UPI000819731C|nr:uncharacterized protein LOC108475201 [Gossypium arboreum]
MRQHADERTKRHKAMSRIQNCVFDMIFTRIMTCETPMQAWNKLKEEFQGTERTRQQQLLNLRRDFENLKMKEEETVKQYSDRIMAVVNSIRLLGEQFDEAMIVEKVLSILPERYEAKISSLEDLRDLARISLTELINALYAQEQRRASRIEEHQESAFQAKVKPKSSNTAYKGKKNWKDKSKTDAPRKWDRPCRHCKKPGHLEAKYWFKPDAICQHCKKRGHVEKVCKEKDRPGQNQPQHKGAEARVTEQGSSSEEQVFAVSCLVEKGKNKGLDSVYATSIEESKLWHQRLGHANFKSMARMISKDMAENFIKLVQNEDVCEVCQLVKQAKLPFPTSTAWRALEKLQLVHTDVCGPMKTESLNGNRYFILFIDDSTRYYWICFLKNKSEVVQAFLKFKTAAETETGCILKSIRSDNGTKYTSA